MNLRVGDSVEVLSGQYAGMYGKIVKIMQVLDNARISPPSSFKITWRPVDGLRPAFDILVSVEGFNEVWFTPGQVKRVVKTVQQSILSKDQA